jgi:endonuclease/exonuclease/phosphatase family metal-dependent hydrolase
MFRWLTWFLAIMLILACIVPYARIPTLAFLSLVVPLLVIINVTFLFLWLLLKRKLLWHSLFALAIGYASLGSFLQFNDQDDAIEKDGLKVMSFNVQGFNEYEPIQRNNVGDSIVEFIKREDPDIICFQEYSRSWYKKLRKYPYFSQTPYSNGRTVQAIFSKFPIVGEGSMDFHNSTNNTIYADILYSADTLRVYNIHLESLKIRPSSLKREESRKLLGRLRFAFSKQQEQALRVREHADRTTYKTIFCADLNNNQFSYAYKVIKGPMLDSFSEMGNGYGRTIDFWRFPLRIDFIMVDPSFEVLDHHNYSIDLSDHEPIMATLGFGQNE